jgi:hypothetical protein
MKKIRIDATKMMRILFFVVNKYRMKEKVIDIPYINIKPLLALITTNKSDKTNTPIANKRLFLV